VLDRFVLWWCRTWVLWCLALSLVCLTAPIKAYQLTYEAVTGDAFWAALATDLDVGGAVEAQAERIMVLVPVDELQGLKPMLGEERTEQLVGEAQQIRDGVAEEVGTATSRSINKVVGESVPRFLMGEDLTGNQLSQDLMLDLRPVRSDLEAWLTQAGRLIVDAIAEAVQQEIKAFMAPAISELAQGQEVAGLEVRLLALENSFTLIADTMHGVGELVGHVQALGIVDDEESAEAAKRLTATVARLARMGITAVGQGREVLAQATLESGEPDWEQVVDQVTTAMLDDAIKSAKQQTDIFAKDFTQTIVGSGTYTVPASVRRVMVEQLRPGQLVLAPTVTAGGALNAVLLAGLWSLGLLMVLVSARVRRASLWLGLTGMLVGASSAAIAATMSKIAHTFALGLGAMGQAVTQAGDFIARMLSWCWGALRFILDIEDTEFRAIEGWTTADVLDSATFGVLQSEVFERMDDWASTMMIISGLVLLLWLVLLIAELVGRSRPQAAAGSILATLQQPGGMRIEDPLLCLLPRRGPAIEGAHPHAAASRLLARGVVVDLSWTLLSCLMCFSILGLSVLMVFGPAGGGAAVVTASALMTGGTVITVLLALRIPFAGGRTLTGALCGEVLIDHTGSSAPWRLRSLLALLPWVGALCVGTVVVCLTDSAMLGLGLALGLLLIVELSTIVLSGGTQTLGAKLMDRRCTAAGTGIKAPHRRKAITLLTRTATIWSIGWGFVWFGFFGLGFYALVVGCLGGFFWYRGRKGPPSAQRVRLLAFLHMGNWLSLDFVGICLGLATLWLLQDEAARAHFTIAPPAEE